ncbi:MAG: S-methyl-5-thioribose-1-phosphate isomerase [Bacteroidota bacterium]
MDALTWKDGHVLFLDQTRLPGETIVCDTDDPEAVIEAIRRLAIRGAPLIGIGGGYAAVLAARRGLGQPWSGVDAVLDRIATARPTAVNLSKAVQRIRCSVRDRSLVVRDEDVRAMESEALAVHEADRIACERIARNGVALLPEHASVLTHCNTGALATGGGGTAFGIIRSAWEQGRLRHLYIDETRPLLQGSRLTTWEAMQHGIPATLITDATAALVMRQDRVDAVVVGADRIAMNGDVANKVGTYGLAVLARSHGIPFYVAAPLSSVDEYARGAKNFVLEERPATEVTMIGAVSVAPPGVHVFAPAFDVTPANLITAIVTDAGVVVPPLEGGLDRFMGTVRGT